MLKTSAKLMLAIIFLITQLLSCSQARPNWLKQALKADSDGNKPLAISLLQKHMDQMRSEKLESKENIALYYLDIAKIYSDTFDFDLAEQHLEMALNEGVKPNLVVSSVVAVAERMTEMMLFSDALKLLEKYRQYDPLIIDGILDRNAKKLNAYEQLTLDSPAY